MMLQNDSLRCHLLATSKNAGQAREEKVKESQNIAPASCTDLRWQTPHEDPCPDRAFQSGCWEAPSVVRVHAQPARD